MVVPSLRRDGVRIRASPAGEMTRPFSRACCHVIRSAAVAQIAPAANGSDQVMEGAGSRPPFSATYPFARFATVSCTVQRDAVGIPSGAKTSFLTYVPYGWPVARSIATPARAYGSFF